MSYLDETVNSVQFKEYNFYVAYTGLPVVYISTENNQPVISKTEKVSGTFELVAPKSTIYKNLKASIQINGRGNTGWYGTPKKSYNIKFETKESVCGMEKSRKWALIDNYHDRSLLRNKYIAYLNHHVFTDLGWNPSYVHCDLVMNGEYMGNYIIAERIKIESGRVNIKDISKVDDITKGGFICEVNERMDESFNFRTTHGVNTYTGNTGVAISLKDPDEVSEEIQGRVQTVVQTAEDVLFSDSFADIESGWRKYFDEKSVIDWYLIHEFACMFDASDFYTSAYFYYNPKDKKLHMGPCWDYDTAMRREKLHVTGLELSQINSWYKRFFEDKEFVWLVKQRWAQKKYELKNSIIKIDDYKEELETSAEYNFIRWKILGTHYEGIDSWESLKTYSEQVDSLKEWVNKRIEDMDLYLTN